jgi:predicted dehydrogenase
VTGRRRFVADSLVGLSAAALGSAAAGACRPASGAAAGVAPGPAPAAAPSTVASAPQRLVGPRWQDMVGANDRVRVATIGMGIMGFKNSDAVRRVPGVELAAVCDLYDGRLRRARELYGDALRTSKNSDEIMQDRSIDAVIVATGDHWHQALCLEALRRGKAVYCEKPLVHRLDQGLPLIEAARASGRPLQVGSQRVSSIVYEKARELYRAGSIGQLVVAEAHWDRQSALGAWQYSIPRDASPETVDFERFLGNAPRVPFDAVRFFRWRNYSDYGTGVAGDLFVHLFSGLHLITGSLGPTRIHASGGLRHWRDGRDVADVMVGTYDYAEAAEHPAFNLQLRVNLADGGGGDQRIALIGTEGEMSIDDRGLTLSQSRLPDAPGFGGWDTYDTFDAKTQQEFAAWYAEHYRGRGGDKVVSQQRYEVEPGYSDHLDHHHRFIQAVRGAGGVVEDAAFGFRAAAPALASNLSMAEGRVIGWDPVAMRERA